MTRTRYPGGGTTGAAAAASLARVTTNIVGGLGNQLFLVANLLATSRRSGVAAVLHRAPHSSSCGPPRPTYWSSMFAELHRYGVADAPATLGSSSSRVAAAATTRQEQTAAITVVEVCETRQRAPVLLDAARACTYYLVGFFQSAVYFDDAADVVRCAVAPRPLRRAAAALLLHAYCHHAPDMCSSSSARHIACVPLRSDYHCIGLHVRRGDYAGLTDVFALLQHDYYDAALRQLLGRTLLLQQQQQQQQRSDQQRSALRVLVFCEDAQHGTLLVDHLRRKYVGLSVVYVCAAHEQQQQQKQQHSDAVARANESSSNNSNSSEDDDSDGDDEAALLQRTPREVLELLMLAACDDVVMANSTFSWWAAYLNEQPLHRVVAPSRWFAAGAYTASAHLYCDDWLVL